MQPITSEIIQIQSAAAGPTVAIIAGVHGNETAGIWALQHILPELTITRGTLYVAFANPPAIDANVRFLNKNLNRCFFANNNGDTYEDRRARELMEMFDRCDALLDLHMFYDDDGLPFVICEDDAMEVAQKFDVDIISTNWTEVEPGGSDSYMHLKGKIGICVECGPIAKAAEYTKFATQTVYQFLRHFDMADKLVDYSTKPKRLVRAEKAVLKTSAAFVLTPGLRNFERLQAGQVIATDGQKQYVAQEGDCIIFPHYKARLNEEAYIIGRELPAQ